MKTASTFGLLLLVAIGPVQSNGIDLGAVHRVSVPSTVRYEMVWAQPNAQDARYVMVCGMDEDTHANRVGGYIYTSSDAGTTWARTATDASSDWVSEEHCAYGANGNAYFTASESNTDTGIQRHEYGKFQLFVSHDYGMTWHKTVTRGFVDWTFAHVLMPTASEPERLVIFGNSTASKPGHWDAQMPVAFESTDDGISLQGPFGVPPPANFEYDGEFAFGTAALPGDMALFSAASRHAPRATQSSKVSPETENAELFAYSARTRTLRSFSIVHRGAATWSVSMARDESPGPFRGRLYVGWIETVGNLARAVLAASDDNGATWSSHEILHGSGLAAVLSCHREPTIEGLHLAVNTAGVLGMSWIDYGAGMYFAVSRDGGKNFSSPVRIARYPRESSTAYYSRFLDAVSIDEYSGALMGYATKKRSLLQLASVPGLGISLRVNLITYSDASDVVADADGLFHAFWSQPGMEGQSLWTRTVSVSTDRATGMPSITLPASDMNTDCAQMPPPAFTFPMDNPGRDATLQHWTDISSQLGLRLSNLNYDRAAHEVSLDVQFINLSKHPIRGSLAMTATGVHSDFGHPQPLDAERTFRGGATWSIGKTIPPSGLLPGQRSFPFRIHFHIPDFHAVQPQNILDAVAMGITIYQK